jgi:hypothetical protein
MANGWGELEWGTGEWSLQSNSSALLTSQSLSTSLNSVSVTTEVNDGWGRFNWGEGVWGQTGDILLSGQQLSASLNSVLITAEVNNGWSAYGWGITGWGTNEISPIVEVTGQNLTTSLNSVSFSIDGSVLLTGQSLSVSLDSVSITGTANISLSGELANLTLNSVDALPIIFVPVTAPGTPTTWGSVGWGQLGWGENIGLSTFEGTNTIDLITPVNVTGQLLNTSLNSVSITGDSNLTLTGQILTAELSSVGITADGSVSIPVFENPLSLALGTVDPAPDANVTGQQLTLSFNGNVDIDIAVTAVLTSQLLSTSLNSVTIDLNTPVNLIGQSLTLSLNLVVAKTDVIINITGFGLTGTTGQLYVAAWTPVNTGQSINWTEVAA